MKLRNFLFYIKYKIMNHLLPAKMIMDMLAKKSVYVHLEMTSWLLTDLSHCTHSLYTSSVQVYICGKLHSPESTGGQPRHPGQAHVGSTWHSSLPSPPPLPSTHYAHYNYYQPGSHCITSESFINPGQVLNMKWNL